MLDAEAGRMNSPYPRVKIWDAPVRVSHALLLTGFIGAWLSAESHGSLGRLLHLSFGLSMAGGVAFRLLWGLIGSPPARFANFLRSPAAAVAHLRALVRGQAQAEAGHNPAGGWAVLALLIAVALTAGSGWLHQRGWGGHAMEEVHELAAHGLLLLVVLHVLAVLLTSALLRDPLPRGLLDGRKRADPRKALRRTHRLAALALLLAVAGFWSAQLSGPWIDAGPGTAHEADDDD